MDHGSFRSPADIFRGTDFWMLNGALCEEELRRQLRGMHEQGVRSIIARTYIGLQSDYPGADFKKKMHCIVDTAKELGMRVFLQAGYMPEAVLGMPEEYALRFIRPVKEGEENGRNVLCRHGGISFTEENSHTFLDMFTPRSVQYYLQKSYGEMWEEFTDEFGRTVASVWVDEPSYSGSFLPWSSGLADAFAARWGYSLTDVLWKLYTDADGAETVRWHYRVLMRDLMEENYFRAVRDWCHARGLLFSGHLMMEETLTSQIRRAQACMPYYRYFDIPGIDVLTASMNWTDDPILPSDPAGGEKNYTLCNTALQCVSAAHQAGQKHILAEMYGVVSENMTFRNQMHLFDSYAAMGITHRCVHGMFYTLRGRGKRAYPPHIQDSQPFWEKYGRVTDYTARVSAFLADGEPAGDIAVIHPLESGYMLYCGSADPQKSGGGARAERYDTVLYDVLSALKTDHRDTELCDLVTLERAGKAENGILHVGVMQYGCVILPDLRGITREVLELLCTFAESGGRLIVLGGAPEYMDGVPDPLPVARLAALPGVYFAGSVTDMRRAAAQFPPSFTLDGIGARNILVNHRVAGKGEKFFLFNRDCAHDARVVLETDLADGFAVCRYDAEDGSVRKIPADVRGGRARISLTVPAGRGILLSSEEADENVDEEPLPAARTVLGIDGGWRVLPREKNMLLLEKWQCRIGEGAFTRPLTTTALQHLLTQKDVHAEITLRTEIRTRADLSNLYLALEAPELQTVLLDGQPITGTDAGFWRDRAFRMLPLGGVLRAGTHILEVKRYFSPLTKTKNALTQLFEARHGTELEPMYLLGDFEVYGHLIAGTTGAMCFGGEFELDRPDGRPRFGELTAEGYPFYTGVISLEKELLLPEDARLCIGVMNAGAGAVYLNGQWIGDILRAPAEIPLGGARTEGLNRLEIRLYSTLRNAIGPFHRPRGEIGSLFGGGYENPDAAWLSLHTDTPGWENDPEGQFPAWWDNYSLVPLGIDRAEIRWRGGAF